MVEYNILNARGWFNAKEYLCACDSGESPEQALSRLETPFTFADVEKWAQPTNSKAEEVALCKSLAAKYFPSGFLSHPRIAGKWYKYTSSTEDVAQIRRLLSLALRLHVLLREQPERISEETLLGLGFTKGKPEGASKAPEHATEKPRASIYWSTALPLHKRGYGAVLQETCNLGEPNRSRAGAGHHVSAFYGATQQGEETLLWLSISADEEKGWCASCAELLLEHLWGLHLARATVRASVAHGIEIQTTDGLTSLWIALVESCNGGRIGQCPICGRFFRATNERKEKRVWCETGGKCAQKATRARKFAELCEAGTDPAKAAKSNSISVATALQTMKQLGIERRAGIDYGEE